MPFVVAFDFEVLPLGGLRLRQVRASAIKLSSRLYGRGGFTAVRWCGGKISAVPWHRHRGRENGLGGAKNERSS